jgi:hypothetical protein
VISIVDAFAGMFATTHPDSLRTAFKLSPLGGVEG